MTAQILLFPARRIRRLTCAGRTSPAMLIVAAIAGLPQVEHNQRHDLLYAIFTNPSACRLG